MNPPSDLERIPEWLRDTRDDDDYWRKVITEADVTVERHNPFEGHAAGECVSCDAQRLLDEEEAEAQ